MMLRTLHLRGIVASAIVVAIACGGSDERHTPEQPVARVAEVVASVGADEAPTAILLSRGDTDGLDPIPLPGHTVRMERAPAFTPPAIDWPIGDPEDWLQAAEIPPELRAQFLAVGRCESGLNPSSVGDDGSSLGWLQVQPQWHLWRLADLGYPEDPDLFFDPVIAARVGYHIWQEKGWAPWTCSRVLDD